MKNDNYVVEYEKVKQLTIGDLMNQLNSTKGKNLNELKVVDLTYHNSIKIWPGEGVYLFRENSNILYVGKASSMSFTERIPKHFDIRHFAWFNRLLELICTRKLGLDWNDEGALIASKYAFDNLNLVLINFTYREKIERTERLLRATATPLNKFKKLKVTNREIIVDSYFLPSESLKVKL